MRIPVLMVLFLLFVAGVLAVGTPLFPSAQEDSLLVRVNGARVHFRESLPHTKEREDIDRYADPKATYIAYDRKHGEVAGYSGDFLELANQARDERGWVAAYLAQAIHPADRPRLEQLGSASVASEATLLQLWDNLLNIAAALISIVTSGWLIRRLIKYIKKGRQVEPAKGDASPSQEVKPFPREVPASPPTMGPSTSHKPPILYGVSGNTVWIHRPRKERQR